MYKYNKKNFSDFNTCGFFHPLGDVYCTHPIGYIFSHEKWWEFSHCELFKANWEFYVKFTVFASIGH